VLNRNGIRIGTGEIYSSIESLEFIRDSLVIGFNDSKGVYRIALFVVLKGNFTMEEKIIETVRKKIRNDLSPRHIPDYILQARDVPYTLNGKKMEIPVTRIIEGNVLESIINMDSVRNPDCLDYYIHIHSIIY
ncbi:MAG: acetoacetate--CoA ligase, partial [Candidatus Thermoplasmatota archaeon]|nr:acetoacetate--CoA ligase [Candidatus Thermoplasmatota archaeon]